MSTDAYTHETYVQTDDRHTYLRARTHVRQYLKLEVRHKKSHRRVSMHAYVHTCKQTYRRMDAVAYANMRGCVHANIITSKLEVRKVHTHACLHKQTPIYMYRKGHFCGKQEGTFYSFFILYVQDLICVYLFTLSVQDKILN